MTPRTFAMCMLALAGTLAGSVWGCDLKVEGARIRKTPGDAPVLAGYARLRNAGATTLTVTGVSSPAFDAVMAHESVVDHGMAMMRPLTLRIPAGGQLVLSPGAKHLMLMDPKKPLGIGEVVMLTLTDDRGCAVEAPFTVEGMK